MIACRVCGRRVRPPGRVWHEGPDGRARFPRLQPSREALARYRRWLERLARRVPFEHESCWLRAGRPAGVMVALSLEARLPPPAGGKGSRGSGPRGPGLAR